MREKRERGVGEEKRERKEEREGEGGGEGAGLDGHDQSECKRVECASLL